MSKLRLIPKLLLRKSTFSNNLVNVVSNEFSNYIEIGNPVSQSKIFQDQGCDELIFININENNINEIYELSDIIKKISKEIFMPLTVGGGIRKIDDIRLLLKSGADKISINSIAIENPLFIEESSQKFGSQCIVISIDYKVNPVNNIPEIFIKNGKINTKINIYDWVLEVEELGAGEILLCDISNDGKKTGLNNNVASKVSNIVSIPIINSGGCGIAQHFIDGFLLGNASAISAGTFFAHQDQNFIQTRSHIYNAGINIRKVT